MNVLYIKIAENIYKFENNHKILIIVFNILILKGWGYYVANGEDEKTKRSGAGTGILLGKIFGPLLILAGLLFSIYFVWAAKSDPLISLGIVGLVTFTSVLFGTYLLTKEWDFGCGEFRKTITISILAVFFATLAFGDKIVLAQDTILAQVFSNFWAILSTVIAFYFAARVVDKRTTSQEQNNQQAQDTPPTDPTVPQETKPD